MSNPFIAELRLVSFNFAPKGWVQCNGQLLPINQYQAVFSLMGTTYGGNGQNNFGLPDLRGRTPMSQGAGHSLGERAGTESVTLNGSQVPQHTHLASAISNNANATAAAGGYLSATANIPIYNGANDQNVQVQLNSATVSTVGGNQAHANMQPYLVLNWVIALQGIFPSQN